MRAPRLKLLPVAHSACASIHASHRHATYMPGGVRCGNKEVRAVRRHSQLKASSPPGKLGNAARLRERWLVGLNAASVR